MSGLKASLGLQAEKRAGKRSKQILRSYIRQPQNGKLLTFLSSFRNLTTWGGFHVLGASVQKLKVRVLSQNLHSFMVTKFTHLQPVSQLAHQLD
jgi:hypothetical protein